MHGADFKRMQTKEGCSNAGFIYTWEAPLKFYKAYGDKVSEKPIIWVTPDFPRDAKSVKLDIENEFLEDCECFNVIAKVEGKNHDKCYVFTAHYDHLGILGKKTYYPGAHDNASGTAAIITLAAHYAKHTPEYDMYFIAFSGEDANLRGSEWYAEHPVAPLSDIKYLFNLDMIGDNNANLYCEVSDEGMAGYPLFEEINSEKGYFNALDRAELADNSDHYPFAVRNVPCIFFMNENGDAFKYYHTVYDTWENAIFDFYEPTFKLIVDFVERYE
jgi:Zn-dependent M28 family amino/carboxypeptidase